MRSLQEQVNKPLLPKNVLTLLQINCSSDLKIFANSQPSALNAKSFSRSLEQFFLTVGQKNLVNKIPFPIRKMVVLMIKEKKNSSAAD